MTVDKTNGVHWSFWVMAALALIWHTMGAGNFVMQMNPEALAKYPESHRAIIDGRPAWATAGFAIAVFGGALGCLLLLLRKSVAFYLFIASLLGAIAALVPTFSLIGSAISGPFDIAMMIVSPLGVAVFLIWYTKHAERKGWIR